MSRSIENLTWDSSRGIALIINDKFPFTDVLSLSDTKLLKMMKEAEILDKLPEIDLDEREDSLFMIKCALARVIEGDEDYNAHQHDAET